MSSQVQAITSTDKPDVVLFRYSVVMPCGGCSNAVKTAVGALKGVENVETDLETKIATVTFNKATAEASGSDEEIYRSLIEKFPKPTTSLLEADKEA